MLNRMASRILQVSALFVAVLFVTSRSLDAATIVYNFDVSGDDGQSTDGWTTLSGLTAPSAPSTGGRSASANGISPAVDGAHTTLLFRSPKFWLDGTGNLFFDIAGGQGNGPSPAILPTSAAAVPVGLPATDPGVQGVALRDDITGAYVLTFQKPVNADSWATYSWTTSQLAPYANNGRAYTFDFYEYKIGGWGHIELDDVIIPGSLNPPPVAPEPSSLLLLGLGALVLRRTRRLNRGREQMGSNC